MYREMVERREKKGGCDKLQCCFTAVSNEVCQKCDLNLEKREHYSNKTTSMTQCLYQSSQPWFHLCGVITAGSQN